MKTISSVHPFILLLLLSLGNGVYAQVQRQTQESKSRTASISGRITVEGNPAANARVVATELKDPMGNHSFQIEGSEKAESYTALTDGDGRYRIANLPNGKYRVEVMLRHCVKEKESSDRSLNESVSLDEGESVENVDFRLIRGGVITGRVTDPQGRPLISRSIQLQIPHEQGKNEEFRQLFSGGIYQTDDRGIYRLYGLRPGKYLVSVGGDQGAGFLSLGGGSYPRTWYPDVTDVKQAKAVEVTAGGEVTEIDIRFGSAKKTFEAIGHVVDDEMGKPIVKAQLMCLRTKGEDGNFGGWDGIATTDEQGAFRFNGLSPGQYHLSLADFGSFLTGKGGDYYSEGSKFEVQGGDVANLEVRVKRGATVSGIVVLEMGTDPAAKSNLSQMMIIAQSQPSRSERRGDDDDSINVDFGGAFSRVGGDGAFTVRGVRPGRLRFKAQGMTDRSLKVVRVERGGMDLREGIEITGRENISGVRIVLAKAAGVIRGQVKVTGGELPEEWRMMVFATNEKESDASHGFAVVDDKHRFVIEGLLPGEYTLMLQARPRNESNSSGRLENFEPVTQRATVTKGMETSVTMTLDLNKKKGEKQ